MIIDLYVDIISPYTYLGLELWERSPLRQQHQTRIVPVALGQILEQTGNPGPARIPAKRPQALRDVCMQCARFGVDIQGPHGHPFNTLPAMRFLLCIEDLEVRHRITLLLFRSAWAKSLAVDTEERIATILRDAGEMRPEWEDLDTFIKKSGGRNLYKNATNDAVTKGVFGVPTFRIGEMNIWGSDRIPLVEDWLAHPERYPLDNYQRMLVLPSGL